MPVTVATLDTIQNQINAWLALRFPNRDVSRESFLGKSARAWSMALLLIQKSIADADKDASPSSDASTAALDNFAFTFGLPSNAGGYGRDGATTSSGGVGLLGGTKGTVFNDGLILLAPDGVTQLKLSGAQTIPGSPPGTDTKSGNFVGVTTGIAANLATGTVLTFTSPPSGGASTVTLTSPLAGALDRETDALLLDRILERLQQPPKGGAANDYKIWAESVGGVFEAFVYPHRGGLGTVETVITAAGSGTGRAPSRAVRDLVDEFVRARMPSAMQGYATRLPGMASQGMTIEARLTPSSANYAFDWDDTATTYTVDTYTPGSPATLKLNTLAPASLKDAVTGGAEPRIVVAATAGPAVPVQVQATAYVDGGGKTTLTLQDPLPTGFLAPSVGDLVTAGGPGFTPVAQAILDYVDSLGPSRTGFASVLGDLWEDTCAIARLNEVALSTEAEDGTRYFSNVAVANGITINGSATDKIGDANLGGSPELLWAEHIVVKQ